MRLLKCPKCGEMFSDTYKTCPFCQEDEERHSSKPVKNAGRRTGGGRAKPKVGGVVIVCLVLVLGLAAYTIFGNQITAFFTGEKDAPTPEPAVLTMNKTSVELTVGSSFALTVSGADKVAFSSSDEAVATVCAVITASAADTTATCRVAVTAAVDQPTDPVTPDVPDTPVTPDTPTGKDLVLQSIYGSRGQFSLNVGETAPLEVDGTESSVTWSSSDTKIATVDASGVVTAVSSGKTTITAAVDGQTLSIEVLVW